MSQQKITLKQLFDRKWSRFFLFFLISVLVSCAQFDRNDFKLERKLKSSLPRFKIEIDHETLKKNYWVFGEVLTNKTVQHFTNGSTLTKGRIKNIYVPTMGAKDTSEIVLRELKSCLYSESNDSSQTRGFLQVRFAGKQQSYNSAWMFPSVFTLSLINVFGFPFGSQDSRVGLEIVVMDSNRKILGRYSGIGETTEWAAYYWGYSPAGAGRINGKYALPRATLAAATLNALNNALDKLEIDSDRLSDQLSLNL